ncbi:MAG: TetR/AcrR family transcriptional regulator [Bacillus subtilis]|nr:TetR/AcrR family transcriptional regulator [Bacillus subtilis]
MPKSTFDNLPESKKRAIIIAARQEFAAVPFAEASINRIIKSANISRGSFYQYFENKVDLVRHLLSRFYQRFHTLAKDQLRQNGGDWIETRFFPCMRFCSKRATFRTIKRFLRTCSRISAFTPTKNSPVSAIAIGSGTPIPS